MINNNNKLNKKLLNMNKSTIEDKSTLDKINKQEIVNSLSFDTNDELAIILNVLQENLELLKDSTHKTELVNLLNMRTQVKKDVKGE